MKSTPFHLKSLRALASLASSPPISHGARHSMSLVLALRLANGDVLFAADKRSVVKNGDGVVAGQTDNATKLRTIAGGVVAYAGNASLAQNLLRDLALDAETERMEKFRRALCERFARIASCYPNEAECEFLASDRGRLFRLQTPHFVPIEVDGDFGAIGVTVLAQLIYGLFYPERDLTLPGAARLAALQIIVTASADSTNVSDKMDMWLLRHGHSTPDVMEDVESVREWVDAYRTRTLAELHGF